MTGTLSLKEIADQIGARVRGNEDYRVASVASLKRAGSSDISFVTNSRWLDDLGTCRAGALVMRAEDVDKFDGNVIVSADPYLGYARVAALLDSTPVPNPGIHSSAIVAASAQVDPTASVGAGCVIEDGAEIGAHTTIGPGSVIGVGSVVGAGTRLYANVTLYHRVQLGQRCTIQSGAVLGSDGFGNAQDNGRWVRIPQLGGLRIGDDVQIGANTTIDRGALDDTVIGNGVVIDNLCQIAHNCVIGDHTALAGCCGLAGSTIIGHHCMLAGGVGVAGHLTITDHVQITGMSLVSKSITRPGVYSSGTSLQTNRDWRRNAVRFRSLDSLFNRLKEMEKKFSRFGLGSDD